MQFLEIDKKNWSAFVSAYKKQFSSQKIAFYRQIKVQAFLKKEVENAHENAPKFKQFVEMGWCNETVASINLKCKDIFARGLQQKLKDFDHKRLVKHTFTLMEPSIPFHALVELVDAKDNTNEKNRTIDLPLEIDNVPSKLASQNLYAQTYDPNLELKLSQTTDPNKKK